MHLMRAQIRGRSLEFSKCCRTKIQKLYCKFAFSTFPARFWPPGIKRATGSREFLLLVWPMYSVIWKFLNEFCYISAHLSLYVCLLGRVSTAVIIFSKGMSWSPNGKELHWMNSAALFLSRILHFSGYDAFKIEVGSQWKYCLRAFPQWELCHNWFSLYQTNKWNFIFRDRQPSQCNDKRTLPQDRQDPCRAFFCGKSMGRERETPHGKSGVLVK